MKRLLYILSLYLMWLPVFMVQKPVFMLYHLNPGKGVTAVEWFQVMLHGLKLDMTVAGYLTIIPFLSVLLSFWLPGRWLKKMLHGYYAAVALPVAVIFAADLGLYGFWGFRIDSTVIFYLQSSFRDAMASVPAGGALFLSFVAIIYMYIIYWLFGRLILSRTPAERTKKQLPGTGVMLLLGGLMFIAIRGGVTTSTANEGMVYFSPNRFLNHAAINPCFSLLRSLSKQQNFTSMYNFFEEEERSEIFAALVPPSESSRETEIKKILRTERPDILIILLESFSANAIEALGGERGVTPNLNRLSREGVLFTNMYANSFRTDRGLVSVLNAYPAQPTTSIMKYPARSQTLPSIAGTLNREGYTADVLYGGDINFTNMRSYFFGSGYSRITSDRDFPIATRLSKWGANDDVTFSRLYSDLEKRSPADTRRLTTFLTLSSHEPFEVPFRHLDDPYLNSVAFTDSCLGSFIEKAKRLPVWDNLLVILISDHGYRYPAAIREFEPGKYHIPMLWLGGAVKEPGEIHTYTCQTDLAATLLSQMNLPYDDFIFSKDILNPAHPHYAFYTFHNGFGFTNSPDSISVYDNDAEEVLLNLPAEGKDKRLQNGKALLQTLYDDLGSR